MLGIESIVVLQREPIDEAAFGDLTVGIQPEAASPTEKSYLGYRRSLRSNIWLRRFSSRSSFVGYRDQSSLDMASTWTRRVGPSIIAQSCLQRQRAEP